MFLCVDCLFYSSICYSPPLNAAFSLQSAQFPALIAAQCLPPMAANRLQSSLSLLNSQKQIPRQGREMERLRGEKFFKLLQLERFRDFPFSAARFCRTFHRMADPLTLVAYLSSIVRHWVYLNVYLWTRAVKHRLILPGLFQLIPSPRSHNLL